MHPIGPPLVRRKPLRRNRLRDRFGRWDNPAVGWDTAALRLPSAAPVGIRPTATRTWVPARLWNGTPERTGLRSKDRSEQGPPGQGRPLIVSGQDACAPRRDQLANGKRIGTTTMPPEETVKRARSRSAA